MNLSPLRALTTVAVLAALLSPLLPETSWKGGVDSGVYTGPGGDSGSRQNDAIWPTACCAPGFESGCADSDGFVGRSSGAVGDSHWIETALDGGVTPLGSPVRITYSFAPDGTVIAADFGFSGISNLFASMDAIYGDTATWQAIFTQSLERYGELCGVTFIRDPVDDGATIYTFPGEWGTRGDIRFAGVNIDGNGGRLGQGALPVDGDIVIDTGDSFFADTSANSLHLRNLLAHEIGHALGLKHACPQDGTKIMEPSLNLGFDGPQHDEIRQVQHRYGDAREPNESAPTAADAGTIAIDEVVDVGAINSPPIADSARLGIESDTDQDYFRFTVLEASTVDITASPVGRFYERNAGTCGVMQTDCCSGGFSDSLNQADLGLELIDTDGVTILVTAASQPVGQAEAISQQVLPSSGAYFVHVFASNSPAEVQLYDLTIVVSDPPVKPLRITLPNGAPQLAPPGIDLGFDVRIDPGDETLIPTSAQLHYRADGGAFAMSPLTHIGGFDYVATLPAFACGDSPQFYVSATGSINGTKTQPPSGAASPLSLFVGQDIVELDDDFETDQGWTVQNDAQLSDGAWARGTPLGGGDRGDPPTDFDSSGQCYLTDPPDGNTDVDDGTTRLLSPSFDLTGGDTTISYAVWYTNNSGDGPNEDIFVVDISSNGGASWTEVLTLGPMSSAGWTQHSFLVSDFVAPSASVRLRFDASDLINPSVVEAGVDAVRIVRRTCIPPSFGDSDHDGDVDSDDYAQLVDCWAGPVASPSPTPPTTTNDCLAAFDVDADTDVDEFDAGKFQELFTGP